MTSTIKVFLPNSRKQEFEVRSFDTTSGLEALVQRLGKREGAQAKDAVAKAIAAMPAMGADVTQLRVGQRRIRVELPLAA